LRTDSQLLMNAGHINVQAMAWQGMWTPLKWSTHHGSFVVSTQKKPPILQLTALQMPIYYLV
jgi:hypothetical protein